MNNKLLKIAHKFQRSLRNLQLKKFARLKTYNVTALVFGENLSKEPDWTLPDLGRKQITTKSGRPEEIPFLGRIAVDINADSEGNLNIIAGNNILKEWNQTKSIKFPDVISIGKIPQDIQSLSLNSLLESNKLHKLLNEETLADLINSSVFTKTQPFFSGEGYYIFASTDDLENIGYLLLAYQETPLKDIGKPIADKEIELEKTPTLKGDWTEFEEGNIKELTQLLNDALNDTNAWKVHVPIDEATLGDLLSSYVNDIKIPWRRKEYHISDSFDEYIIPTIATYITSDGKHAFSIKLRTADGLSVNNLSFTVPLYNLQGTRQIAHNIVAQKFAKKIYDEIYAYEGQSGPNYAQYGIKSLTF